MVPDLFAVLAACPRVDDGRLLRSADIAALLAAAQHQWPTLDTAVIRRQVEAYLCVYVIGCAWRVLPDCQRPHLVAALVARAGQQEGQTRPGRLARRHPDSSDRTSGTQDLQRYMEFFL